MYINRKTGIFDKVVNEEKKYNIKPCSIVACCRVQRPPSLFIASRKYVDIPVACFGPNFCNRSSGILWLRNKETHEKLAENLIVISQRLAKLEGKGIAIQQRSYFSGSRGHRHCCRRPYIREKKILCCRSSQWASRYEGWYGRRLLLSHGTIGREPHRALSK